MKGNDFEIKFEPTRSPNPDEVARKKLDRELAEARRHRQITKRNMNAVELRLAQVRAANVLLDQETGLKLDELREAVVKLEMAHEKHAHVEGFDKEHPKIEIIWLENGRKKRDFIQDDVIPLILAEIEAHERPFEAAGYWLTAFTNAISQKTREMPE